ncbi:MAG: prepilin peptidase [Microgenomates group bacterium]
MTFSLPLVLCVLGLCVGSFVNCLVWRLHQGLSPIGGRSICPSCKKQIRWYDNIPLVSFVLLKGRCRDCHSPIPYHYPLVELSGGILTLIVFYSQGIFLKENFLFLIFNLLITYLLLAIFLSDLLYMTIPDQIVFSGIIISLVFLFLTYPLSEIFKFLISGFVFAGFFYLLRLFTKGKGMGLGDVKLAGLMGLVLGWPKILVAFYFAFLTGAIVGVILILLRKKRWGEHIPFGPFLSGATFINLIWGNEILKWAEKILGLL